MGMTIACVRCRAQFAPAPGYMTVVCPYCGNVNAAPAMGMMVAPPQAKCSRVAYVLLGFFFGGLGVHNFVAGYTGRGVAQLLICLFTGWLIVPLFVVWIWVFVELVYVSTDANGVPMY